MTIEPHARATAVVRALAASSRAFVALLVLAGPPASGAEVETRPIGGLPPGARLALCGDSITEQMLYTSYVEAYLLACAGRRDISVFQFGWGGENADQFANRVRRGDLDAFAPTAVTVAYGANDSGFQAWQPWMETMWTGRLTGLLGLLASRYPASVQATVVCSPTYFQAPAAGADAGRFAACNGTLGHFRDLARDLARGRSLGFADCRQRMLEAGGSAVAAIGPAYRFAGTDGVHPGPNGHLMIAYEILRALGASGAVATITLDMAGRATASDGHAVVAADAGMVRLSSLRYPFRFTDVRPDAADHPATILPWLPFSRDLNRFTLVVRNLPWPRAEVAWGTEVHAFSAADLAAGVDLAEVFTRTPFDAAFGRLMTLIAVKQRKERDMIKASGAPTAALPGWTAADVGERGRLDDAVHAAIVPVEHTITVRPVAR